MERPQETQKNEPLLKEKLRKQIVYGCGDASCVGIFCKISDIEAFSEEVVQALMEFEEYFLCRSIFLMHKKTHRCLEKEKRAVQKHFLYSNSSLPDLSAPVSDLRNENPNLKKTEKAPVEIGEGARSVLLFLQEDLANPASAPLSLAAPDREERKGKLALLMDIARIMHRKKTKTLAVLLQGLFYREINKIDVLYTAESVVRLIKLFNAVKESVKFEKKYFIRFLGFVADMCTKESPQRVVCTDRCHKQPGSEYHNHVPECGYTEEEEYVMAEEVCEIPIPTRCREIEKCIRCNGSLSECELPHCDFLCFLSVKLCVNEVVELVKSLIIVIDNTSVINMREGTLLIAILKALKALFRFTVETGLLHHSLFVNKRFSRLLNYKVEVRCKREGLPCIMDFPFILDMPSKSDLVQLENADRMKLELQDAFFRSLFQGKVPPYLTLEINRETVVADALRLFRSLEQGAIWKQLKIKFRGEDGIDSGGIKKEFFQLLSQRMLEQWDIFEEKNGFLWVKPTPPEKAAEKTEDYYVLGCILGLAAYNGAVLCFYFPHAFYKKLLGRPTSLWDLKQLEPGLFSILSAMPGMSEEEIEDLDLEIAKNGKKESVTKKNLGIFLSQYKQEVLDLPTQEVFEHIKNGLWSVCGDAFIRSLLPCELATLIGGMECSSFDELEKYTVYNGYRRDSRIVQYFWEIFRSYDLVKQKKFIRFVTGSDRMPSGGLSRMAMVFMRNGGDTERLPSSQTCFNTFLIPEYSTKEKLKEKLDTAIAYTEGFFLL